ncbi:hypothetical protein ES703_32164 [subsurface metagenome]
MPQVPITMPMLVEGEEAVEAIYYSYMTALLGGQNKLLPVAVVLGLLAEALGLMELSA